MANEKLNVKKIIEEVLRERAQDKNLVDSLGTCFVCGSTMFPKVDISEEENDCISFSFILCIFAILGHSQNHTSIIIKKHIKPEAELVSGFYYFTNLC